MTRSQQYLDALLSGVPLEELSAFESRAAFQQMKERVTGAEDVAGELKVLYRVNNFSELALHLLWIAQRAEQDPTMLEPTFEEQTFVLSMFRNAVGDGVEAVNEVAATPQIETTETVEPEVTIDEIPAPAPVIEPEPVPEPTPESEPQPQQSADFGLVEEVPQEGTTQQESSHAQEEVPKAEASAEADPFAALYPASGSEEPNEADPFGMGGASEPPAQSQPEAPAETTASDDPFGMAGGMEESPSPAPPASAPAESSGGMADFPSSSEEPAVEMMGDFPSGDTTPPPAPAAPVGTAGEGSPEMQFAKLVEKFAEALSSGADDRDAVKDEMLNACSAVLADGSASDDHKNFCRVLTDFITYIYENQFVDDIRVMNLLSNVPDPVLAWGKADPGSRAGKMDAAYDTLRDFKSLFE